MQFSVDEPCKTVYELLVIAERTTFHVQYAITYARYLYVFLNYIGEINFYYNISILIEYISDCCLSSGFSVHYMFVQYIL
jgi:hypothetical protein